MLGKLGRLVVLAGAVEGARRLVKANPEMVSKIAAQGASVVDQFTKGRFRNQVDAVAPPVEDGEDPKFG